MSILHRLKRHFIKLNNYFPSSFVECNFSSNIINDTLKSILNIRIYLHRKNAKWSGKRIKSSTFRQLQLANSDFCLSLRGWKSVRFNMEMFFAKREIDWNEIEFQYFHSLIFTQIPVVGNISVQKASGSAQTWNRNISVLFRSLVLSQFFSLSLSLRRFLFLSNQFPFNVTVNTYLWWLFQ